MLRRIQTEQKQAAPLLEAISKVDASAASDRHEYEYLYFYRVSSAFPYLIKYNVDRSIKDVSESSTYGGRASSIKTSSTKQKIVE